MERWRLGWRWDGEMEVRMDARRKRKESCPAWRQGFFFFNFIILYSACSAMTV